MFVLLFAYFVRGRAIALELAAAEFADIGYAFTFVGRFLSRGLVGPARFAAALSSAGMPAGWWLLWHELPPVTRVAARVHEFAQDPEILPGGALHAERDRDGLFLVRDLRTFVLVVALFVLRAVSAAVQVAVFPFVHHLPYDISFRIDRHKDLF
jgi:hypothetical protein